MNKTKIIYLSDSDINKAGGAQQSMKILSNGLANKYDIYIFAPCGEKTNDKHVVFTKYNNFILRENNFFKLIRMTLDINREINKIQPDIIHVQMTSTTIIINILKILKLLDKKIKLIITDRGVYQRYGKVTKKSIDSIVKKAIKVITTTEKNKGYYEKYCKTFEKNKDKFKVIHNTAGENYDFYSEDKRYELRRKLGFESSDFVVGFCGRYGEQKNWGLAEEIILDCHENQRIIKWIIVIGTNKSNEMILEVKKYIDRITKKIGNMNIKYFIDIENESVGELYYAMDCFILTSKWESFGRTAVEAMSRKNIVIGTDVDGLSEVISNPDYLYNSKEEACEIIKKHLNSNELIESAKEYFYLRYKNNFSSTSNLNLYDKLYQDVLKLKSK